MSNFNSVTPALNIVTIQNNGRHYEFIKNSISAPFKSTSLNRVRALAATSLHIENWYHADGHETLKTANLQALDAQNQADQAFGKLQDIYAFAEPLLKARLKEMYGVDEDVKSTFLRLYFPKNTPWYVIDTLPGFASRTVSLLEAALHNFAQSETFTADSEFIGKPDKNGHFDVKPIKRKMSIDQFKHLCRELNIGSRYNRYLRTFLLPQEPLSRALLEHKATSSQKAALNAAAHMALMKQDISANAFAVIGGMIDGQAGLTLNGKVMQCCELSMLDAPLTGIVLFTAIAEDKRGTDRLIAYVPHDPEHPLKEYASALEFVQELTRQLRENKTLPASQGNYWQFFSQFIDQQLRGHFFADLDQRLSVVQWHEKDRLDPGPTWRATPVDKPNLEFRVSPIGKDLWRHLYQSKVSKMINDAREIAVSTAMADAQARWAWWDNFKKMLSDIFNAALLVLTPMVPGLGELMLAYTAYQLTTEVVEGVVDLAEGQWTELAEHVVGVVTDVIQLAAFGAGTAIGNEFRLKLSSFVEGLKPVTLADGKPTLWHPDLKPYEQTGVNLPDTSQPDTLGLHRHPDRHLLSLDGKLYAIEKPAKDDPGATHRIKHPNRPTAYSPKLEHNGQGAWVHEGENPQDWEGETLMRRLGHRVERFSPVEREQMRIISGTDDNELRRMHIEHAPPPPLLVDTVKRFDALQEVQTASANIRAGQALDPESVWFEPLLTGLPGWPAERAMNVYATSDLNGYSRTYGNAAASDANTRAYDGFFNEQLLVPDNERLVLNTLRRFSTVLDEVRIDVRAGTYDAPLRCSAGPEDASTVRQLIRDEHGRYEVFDKNNRLLQAADNFYEAILRALPPEQRAQLGYQRGQGLGFKLWLMEIAAPPAGRRSLLAEPPVRPVAPLESEKLVRLPFWFGGTKTPEQTIKELYPHFSEQQVTDFVRVLRSQGDPEQAIDRINDELKQLRRTLQRWRDDQPTQFDDHGEPIAGINWDFLRTGGTHIEERLLECFERKSEAFGERSVHPDGGYTLDLSTEVSWPDIGRWWKQLRKLPDIQKYLDQITVLNMDNAGFSSQADGVLNDLPNLRQLSARRGGLNGVPRTIGQLQQLRILDLADNRISLSPDSIGQLRGLTRLETLTLDGNPLRRPPDVGDMPNLNALRLARTGIEDWPPGLFRDEAGEKVRPRGFSLDLRQCPIRSLPQVMPGSDHALILARTRISTQRLADADRSRFGDYRESVGLSRQQAYSSAAEDELFHWQPASAQDSVFSSSPSHRSYNEDSWHDVFAEPGAADFFRVIRRQREGRDFQNASSRRQLTARVWQMIDAMVQDTDLREELFQQASQPETCADAGSQLFNNMGMKVLVSRARELSTTVEELENGLVRLARSASRLEKVGDIARAEISSQQQKHLIDPANNLPPDDVEVHLAYETGLAPRLELPWQSDGMLYETRSGVDQARIDRAYKTIIEREAGDGLVNGMIGLFEQPFWEQHLRRTRPAQFEANDRLFDEKLGLLEDLREAQKEWADNQDPAQTTLLARKLERLAQALNVAEDQVFSGEEMSP